MMKGGMKRIRDKYAVPAKRGMTVRLIGKGDQYRITSSTGKYLRLGSVRTGNSRLLAHPLSVDYLVDGAWISGEELLQRMNQRIDEFNAALNRL